MSCVKLSKRKSNISGHGLFAGEFIKKGKIIMIWLFEAKLLDEETYISESQKGNNNIIVTGCRGVGDVFLHTDDTPRYENFINHSETPNVLYHAGVCYALCDIQKDTELTTNYTYLLSQRDEPVIDSITGKKIEGVSPLECLKKTTQTLHELLGSIENDDGLQTKLRLPFCDEPQEKSPSPITSSDSELFPN